MDTAEIASASTVRSPEGFWTLPDALNLIKSMQTQVKRFGFHLCLGGGVLNNGFSKKDLDLYFLPLDDQKIPVDAGKLKAFLAEVWKDHGEMRKRGTLGAVRTSGSGMRVEAVPDYPSSTNTPYTDKRIYFYSGLRIDVFILGVSGAEEGKQENRASTQSDAAPAERATPTTSSLEWMFANWQRAPTGSILPADRNRSSW